MLITILTITGIFYLAVSSFNLFDGGIFFLDRQATFIVGFLLLMNANFVAIENKIDKLLGKK